MNRCEVNAVTGMKEYAHAAEHSLYADANQGECSQPLEPGSPFGDPEPGAQDNRHDSDEPAGSAVRVFEDVKVNGVPLSFGFRDKVGSRQMQGMRRPEL